MLRRISALASLVAVLVILPQLAFAATTNVSIGDNFFSPQQAQVATGTIIHWSNDGFSTHTSTGDSPLNFWDSGLLSPGQTFDQTFWGSGSFTYHCLLHSTMTGIISVRPMAFPRSGPVGTKFTIRAGSTAPPSPYVFDIQKKNPGGSWQSWLTGVTARDSMFDSTGVPIGKYQFRVAVRNTSTGASSRWSPAVSIQVT
jgi:plastocyanin